MSKIGQQPVPLPETVQAQIQPGSITLSGPLGQLTLPTPSPIQIIYQPDTRQLVLTRQSGSPRVKALHGLIRSLIANHVQGVTQGWSKSLELVGTGYRVALEGQNLNIKIGFSHPVIVSPPPGIKFSIEGSNKIHINGTDKQLVGQTAAQIRSVRKPEPYKGKGIRYIGEVIRRKPGKAAKTSAG